MVRNILIDSDGNLIVANEYLKRIRCGRGLFQKCVSIVKTKKNVSEEDWKYVTYLVFDAPDQPVIAFY